MQALYCYPKRENEFVNLYWFFHDLHFELRNYDAGIPDDLPGKRSKGLISHVICLDGEGCRV